MRGSRPFASFHFRADALLPAAKMRTRKTKPHHPRDGAEERLALQRTTMRRARGLAPITDLAKSAAAFELLLSRRHALVRRTAKAPKSDCFQRLKRGHGRPFRLAKLTACRKVGGMYRRSFRKSSGYGHKSAMAQAHLRCRLRAQAGSRPLPRMIRPDRGVLVKAIKAWAAFGSAARADRPAA